MLWALIRRASLAEALLMSTHNIYFYGEIRKIIPELSSNTPPYQVSCILSYFALITDGAYCQLTRQKSWSKWKLGRVGNSEMRLLHGSAQSTLAHNMLLGLRIVKLWVESHNHLP